MEPVFYFFGIDRGKKTFTLTDPIAFKNDCLLNINDYYFTEMLEDRNINFKKFIEEFRENRGILFGFSENPENITKFLKYGKLLSQNIKEKNFSIFFLDDKKYVLFKVNKKFNTWKKAKNEVWKIVKPLNILSEKEFKDNTKKIYYDEFSDFSFELDKLKISIGNFYYLFVCIRPKNYNQLKSKIKETYKGLMVGK